MFARMLNTRWPPPTQWTCARHRHSGHAPDTDTVDTSHVDDMRLDDGGGKKRRGKGRRAGEGGQQWLHLSLRDSRRASLSEEERGGAGEGLFIQDGNIIIPTKKRGRASKKLCAPHIYSAHSGCYAPGCTLGRAWSRKNGPQSFWLCRLPVGLSSSNKCHCLLITCVPHFHLLEPVPYCRGWP